MSLTALSHQYVGMSTTTAVIPSAQLDALWTLLTATTYFDGTTRTPGSGNAWTWARYQNAGVTEAVYGTPPTGSMAQRVLIAGYAVAPTPAITMLGPDTAQTTTLHIGISLSSGAFTTYNAALPFGAASKWSGYWRMTGGVSAGITPTDWRYYETAETVKFVCSVQNTNHRVAHAGAIIDPETPDAVDAETDGRVYGMYVTGSNNSLSSTMLSSNAAAGNYYAHGSLAGYTHSGMFSPGTSTFLTLTRANFLNTSLAHVLPTSTGRSPRWPILLNRGATNFAGRLREVAWTPDSTLGSGLVAGLSTVGYRISSSTSVANETVLLVK
jgi:hypothetical protein